MDPTFMKMFNKDIQEMGLSKYDLYEMKEEQEKDQIKSILDEIFKQNNCGISEDVLLSKISNQYQLLFGENKKNAIKKATTIIEDMRFGYLSSDFYIDLGSSYGDRTFHKRNANNSGSLRQKYRRKPPIYVPVPQQYYTPSMEQVQQYQYGPMQPSPQYEQQVVGNWDAPALEWKQYDDDYSDYEKNNVQQYDPSDEQMEMQQW